jgi:hypothetical protein
MNKPSNFTLVSEVEPWVSANAYADASIDVVVASAGIRLDLTLLRVGIPIGVNVASTGKSYAFKNGGRISIDMLSGSVSAYVEVGISPLDVSYDTTIFSWDGFHTDIPIFGLEKTLPEGVVRVALAGMTTAESAACKCEPGVPFCCSMLTCGANAGCPASEYKTIGGEKHLCAFSKADYDKMVKAAKTTATQDCKMFIIP